MLTVAGRLLHPPRTEPKGRRLRHRPEPMLRHANERPQHPSRPCDVRDMGPCRPIEATARCGTPRKRQRAVRSTGLPGREAGRCRTEKDHRMGVRLVLGNRAISHGAAHWLPRGKRSHHPGRR